MAKKKQATEPQTTTEPDQINLEVELELDSDGYGAVPGVPCHRPELKVTEDDLTRMTEQLLNRGQQVELRSLLSLAATGDENAKTAALDLEANVACSEWNGGQPEGEGWTCIAVLYQPLDNEERPADAVAVWTRPTPSNSTEPAPTGSHAHAELFMVGNLMAAAKRRFCGLAVPYSQLSEREQSRLLEGLAGDVRDEVKKAVQIIAANARMVFRAEVESVQFKGPSDVKSVLKLVNTAESHALADAAGGYVTVVIEQVDELLALPEEATQGEADQRPLFDQSTKGTSMDTAPEPEPEAVEA